MADPMREKIELQVGIPITVAFSFDAGKLCSKRWPGAEDTYARQTTDGRVLFVDATEEMRLRKISRSGQAIILCREQTKSGARYLTIKEPAPQLKSPLGVVDRGIIPDAKYASIEPPAPVWDNVALVHVAELSRGVPSAAGQTPMMPTGVSHAEIIMQSADGGLLGRCICEALDACKVLALTCACFGPSDSRSDVWTRRS